MPTKKIALIQELEEVFDFLNTRIFDSKLKTPTHVFDSKKKDIFRFVPDSFHITVGFGFIKCIPNEDILSDDWTEKHQMNFKERFVEEYVHEMCHIQNYLNGISDCTSNQYHNRKFLDSALSAGFFVGQIKNQGFSMTRAKQFNKMGLVDKIYGPELHDYKKLQSTLDELFIEKDVLSEAVCHFPPQKKKKFFLKYECGCGSSFRSGIRPTSPNAIDAYCNKCKTKYACVEKYL